MDFYGQTCKWMDLKLKKSSMKQIHTKNVIHGNISTALHLPVPQLIGCSRDFWCYFYFVTHVIVTVNFA